ncbi:MAG TPA: hypothetical protein PKM82_12205 [Acidovorax sp.]|nr:hypothetical protein [Acidovorax sp.]
MDKERAGMQSVEAGLWQLERREFQRGWSMPGPKAALAALAAPRSQDLGAVGA